MNKRPDDTSCTVILENVEATTNCPEEKKSQLEMPQRPPGDDLFSSLLPETFTTVCLKLPFRDIQSILSTNSSSWRKGQQTILLWQQLCIRDLGQKTMSQQEETTEIGLARQTLTWREFYFQLQNSSVFTWGASRSIGRDANPHEPHKISSLDSKSISLVGKTAEVGVVCANKKGTAIYVWGTTLGTQVPSEVQVSQFAGQTSVIDCSCGHNSRFMLVMKNGSIWRNRGNQWEDYTSFLGQLNKDEKVLWALGSQGSAGAFVTNQGRAFTFSCYYGDGLDLKANPPPKKVIGFSKAAFGHSWFFGISTEGRLYISPSENTVEWKKVATNPDDKVVGVDGGSRHQGYVTEKGEVWTWGAGRHGCLGHGDQSHQTEPKRVEWFIKNGMKVVSIGCGGHVSWEGGFTLFLLDDNRLFMAGLLGGQLRSEPTPVKLDELEGRHILSISAGEDWAAIVASGSGYR